MANFIHNLLDYAQQVRINIQERYGSSGDLISTSDLKREIRISENDNNTDSDNNSGSDNTEERKFIYTNPLDFFLNHKKNLEKYFVDKISKPIDKAFSNDDNS